MLMMVKSDPRKKRDTDHSRINHVNDMRYLLLFPDGLAAQTYDDILCVDPQ
jgi:hypothetical protein